MTNILEEIEGWVATHGKQYNTEKELLEFELYKACKALNIKYIAPCVTELGGFFTWNDTPQGFDFWNKIATDRSNIVYVVCVNNLEEDYTVCHGVYNDQQKAIEKVEELQNDKNNSIIYIDETVFTDE